MTLYNMPNMWAFQKMLQLGLEKLNGDQEFVWYDCYPTWSTELKVFYEDNNYKEIEIDRLDVIEIGGYLEHLILEGKKYKISFYYGDDALVGSIADKETKKEVSWSRPVGSKRNRIYEEPYGLGTDW